MKRIKIVLLLLLALVPFMLQSCGKKEVEAKNMEQIYKEKGVPVKIEKVEKEFFENDFVFNSVLTGKIETSTYASISDRVKKINVKVGDYIKRDQVVIEFPKDNPSAKYSQAKVAFENSEETYNRYKKLFTTGGISKQQLDNIKTKYEVDLANWNTVSKMIMVKAPISGYIVNVGVRESENVRRDALLFTIADLSKLKAKINVAEYEIDQINIGDSTTAKWNGIEIQGKVVEKDLAMNPLTQAFTAIIEFDNNKSIRAGVTADITIRNKSNSKTIIIEKKDMITENNKNYVFILKDGKAKKIEIKTGKNKGLQIEVLNGLNENDQLIVEGKLLLNNDSKVNVIK